MRYFGPLNFRFLLDFSSTIGTSLLNHMKGSKGRNCNVYREVALTTGNVSEYVVIDNNILDVLNLQDDDKLPLNSLHILEECNILVRDSSVV